MDGISRSCGWDKQVIGWDKEIPHGILPMEQLVLGDMWARNKYTSNEWILAQSKHNIKK